MLSNLTRSNLQTTDPVVLKWMAKQQISSGQALHASVIKLSDEDLLMTSNTIVIPKPLQAET